MRLRDLRSGDTLVGYLLALLGLDVRVPTRSSPQLKRAWEMRALLNYLDSIKAILLLDGLDEVDISGRYDIETQIRDIATYPGGHRLYVTCRTAEFTAPIPNSQVYTILPLSRTQVTQFAERWLGEKATAFIEAVARNPYAGTEVVPLTLAHLCAIYERDGELPPRPIDVYEQIVSLLVEEWDKQRRIVRVSRYADFSWRKKERFLQAAAYTLTMDGHKSAFWESDLARIYLEIAPEFNLPPEEAGEVIHEIESHAGLVHEVGRGRFDFIHLVIQEYLTAMYAHRKAGAIPRLIPKFPNEMALVIAYSSSPEEHLEEALTETLRYYSDGTAQFVMPFLSRLAVETPSWRAGPRLGWTILAFFDQVGRHFRKLDERNGLRLPSEVLQILDNAAIAESIRYAASEADHCEETFAIRLVPKPHASLPPALKSFFADRKEAGLGLLKSERHITSLLRKRRKPPIMRPRR